MADDAGQLQISFGTLSYQEIQSPFHRNKFLRAVENAMKDLGVDTDEFCDTSVFPGSVTVSMIMPDHLLEQVRELLENTTINITVNNTLQKAHVLPDSSIGELCIAKHDTQGQPCLCNPLRDCHECIMDTSTIGSLQGSICTKCKNGKFLLNGICIDKCPQDMKPDGRGQFNLRCSPIITEPAWQILSLSTRIVFSNVPSVLQPQIVIGQAANDLEIKLRAASSGQIFFMSDAVGTAYFSVDVTATGARVEINLGFGPLTMHADKSPILDNQWHNIRILRTGTSVALIVDDDPVLHGVVVAPLGHTISFGPLVSIGHALRPPGRRSFRGCIQNIVLDNVPLTLAQAQSIFDVGSCTADSCFDSPCQNGGTCASTSSTTFVCLCPVGFRGTKCGMTEDICASLQPCHNGGTCHIITESADFEEDFRCACPLEFSGPLCKEGLFAV